MNSTELPVRVAHFARPFRSTPQGARLARHMCAEQLDTWGVPYGSDAHDVLRLVIAELCANAVQHGHVPGRDFHVRLTIDTPAFSTSLLEPPTATELPDSASATAVATTSTVRIEVTDTRAERLPAPGPADASPDGEQVDGRGLFIVEAVADRWGWTPRADGPGKTMWAEYTVTEPAPVASIG